MWCSCLRSVLDCLQVRRQFLDRGHWGRRKRSFVASEARILDRIGAGGLGAALDWRGRGIVEGTEGAPLDPPLCCRGGYARGYCRITGKFWYWLAATFGKA